VSLRREPHLYVGLELIALPPNAIRIKFYDFEGPVNSSCHFPSLVSGQFL
jgi:hypothetical protein